MKSKVIVIFVIVSVMLSGCAGANNTMGQSDNEKLAQTTNVTPEPTIEPIITTPEPTKPTPEPTIIIEPTKVPTTITSDHLIIPGESLGKIKLNMDVEEVYDILGTPSSYDSESITYDSKEEENYLKIYLTENKVSEIIFTSPSFETADGDKIDTYSNLEINTEQYNAWKFQWLLVQVRYTLKEGGLTFYTFNIDSADDNMEHPKNSIGILHNGKNPKYEPIIGADWEKWDGICIYDYVKSSLDEHLCSEDEDLLFSFKIANSDQIASICISNYEQYYIIYRYGTKDKIELEYPIKTENSWSLFTYSYYLRAGGIDNEGLDLNYLSFENDGYRYEIYDEYSAENDKEIVGIKVTNQETKEETDILGDSDSILGSLIGLRDNTKIKIIEQ